jgi:general secretion pathway protein G
VTGNRHSGFTLVELLVVMAIIALLVSIAAPRYFHSVDKARESSLRANLAVMRDSIDKYYSDHGRYPTQLQDLVEKRYLRAIPVDPMTDSDRSWVIVAPKSADQGGVADIRSGAEGKSASGSDYASW